MPCLPSCVYGLKLLPDWRLLTADHSGCVRLWNCRDLVGAARPTLTLQGAFAPSLDSPAVALADAEVGAEAEQGLHVWVDLLQKTRCRAGGCRGGCWWS